MGGRLTYTRETADRICALLREGHSLRTICRDPGMPGRRTVLNWVKRDHDGFAARYNSIPLRNGPSTSYSEDLAAQICAQLEAGRSLQQVCRGEGMPDHTTVLGWIRHDRHGFAARYHMAREIGCYTLFDEMQKIADDCSGDWHLGLDGHLVFDPQNVERARLRIIARRRLFADSQPKTGGSWIDRNAGRDGR